MITCQSMDKDFQVRFSDATHTSIADTSPERGGGGEGFRPTELLAAALGCCINITIRVYAKNHDIPLEGATVTVNLNLDDPNKTVFEYALDLKGNLDEQARDKINRAAKACRVHKALKNPLEFVQR